MRQIPWEFDSTIIRETSSYLATQTWLEHAVNTPGLWGLIGPPGVGKTFGAVAYALRHNIPYICPLPRKTDSINPFVRELCEVLGIKGRDLLRALYEFAEQTALRLIIDEAVRLKRPQLEVIRDLYDRHSICAVLIGTDELSHKLREYDTISHRVVGVFNVPPLSEDDLVLIYGDAEVARAAYKRTGGNWRHLDRLHERLQVFPSITSAIVHEVARGCILEKVR